MTTLRLTPKDLQFLVESIRVTVAPSMPMTPLPELEARKPLGKRVFRAATSEVCTLVAQYGYFGLYIPL